MQDILSGRLLPGERMLWSGSPGQGIIFTPRDICGSAWKRDPVSGVIGVEQGPLIPVV